MTVIVACCQDAACGTSEPYAVSVDAIYVAPKKGKKGCVNGVQGRGPGRNGVRGGGSGSNGCPRGADGHGMIGSSGSGPGRSIQHCGCGKQGGVRSGRTGGRGQRGSGHGGGCPVCGGGGGGGGLGGGGGGGGGDNKPRMVRRSATFVKPSSGADATSKSNARGPVSERPRTRLRHSKSLTSSQFPNLATLLGDGKATQRTTGSRPDRRSQPAPRNSGNDTARDRNGGGYNVSAQRTPRHVPGSASPSRAAGGLSFSRYHTGVDGGKLAAQMTQRQVARHGTSPDRAGPAHRAMTPGRGVRDSSVIGSQRHGVIAKGVIATPRSSEEAGSGDGKLNVRGQAATLYSKDGAYIGPMDGAGSTGTVGTSSNGAGSAGSETGSSRSDAFVDDRRSVYKKAEGFYLPIDSLVPPTPKKTTRKKKKKTGTAFVITFNDSGIESASIEGDDGDNTSSGDETETTAPCDNGPDPAQTNQKLSDPIESSSGHDNWAANQQNKFAPVESSSGGQLEQTPSNQPQNPTPSDDRSRLLGVGAPTPIRSSRAEPTSNRGRRTPVPVRSLEGDFGPQSYGLAGQSVRSSYLRESRAGSDPVANVRSSYHAYQQARRGRKADTRGSVDAGGITARRVDGAATERRRRESPLADVSAYLRRSSNRRPSEDRRLDTAAMKRVSVTT